MRLHVQLDGRLPAALTLSAWVILHGAHAALTGGNHQPAAAACAGRLRKMK